MFIKLTSYPTITNKKPRNIWKYLFLGFLSIEIISYIFIAMNTTVIGDSFYIEIGKNLYIFSSL